MTIQECNFLYAGRSSEEFNLIMVDFSEPTASNDESSELLLSTTPYRRTWSLHAVQKSEPLKFRITLCKSNGEYLDAYEESEIKEWLIKDNFNWFSVDQTDLANTNYFCILSNPQKVNVARRSGGISFDVTCNSQGAWSNLMTKNYVSTTTYTFNFYNHVSYDKFELLPTLTITSNANQNISIKNNTINKTVTINNCLSGETIIIDSENDLIDTTATRNIIDAWNVETLSLVKGNNSVTLTGNFLLKLEYRLPVRIGG